MSVMERTKYCAVYCGAQRMLPFEQLLEDFAAQCGQPAAMHWLRHFVSGIFPTRIPYLVLITRTAVNADRIPALDELVGAVLFDEFRWLGIRTRTFSTDDRSGFRTVIGPAEIRGEIVARACEEVLLRRAHFVLATYENPLKTMPQKHLQPIKGMMWACSSRQAGRHLLLQSTFEATLKKLGKATRFNLGYYRRRLTKQMPCEFVSNAGSLMTLEDMRELNADSHFPAEPAMCEQRWYSSTTLRGSYLLGLRTTEGQWLGLIGGWRAGDTTVLQWQLNRAGLEKDSLSVVLRSYFIEHEIELGMRHLIFHGGTKHPIQNSFEQVLLTDFMVRRRSLIAWIIMRAAPLLATEWRFALRMLRDKTLSWRLISEMNQDIPDLELPVE